MSRTWWNRLGSRRPAFAPRVEALETRDLLTTVFALTPTNQLLSFDSSNPERLLSGPAAITGLQGGETLVGIDFRPADGRLYGVGSSNRVYVIDTTTAAATSAGAPFTPGLAGRLFGVDFNPVPDRIRVTSDSTQNLRLNPATGALAGVDTNLAYAAGDENFGEVPGIVGVAYTNNFAGATTTTLYGIDSELDVLVLQGSPGGTPVSPNTGQLRTVGSLDFDTGDLIGFDITPDGTAFASLTDDGFDDGSEFFAINLLTGEADRVGPIGNELFVLDIAAVAGASAQNLAFVQQVYRDLLGRELDAAGQQLWVGGLNAGTMTRVTVAQGIVGSTEYRSGQLDLLYQSLLGRAIDPTGQSSWLAFLAAGGTLRQVQSGILGSAEYFQTQGGGTNAGFLNAVYVDVLNRAIDPAGSATWTAQLNSGVSRQQVAQSIVSSPESNALVVTGYYQQFLRRDPDAGGLNTFVTQLNTGIATEQVIVSFVSSTEYFQLAAG
jgi:hypothetical protein